MPVFLAEVGVVWSRVNVWIPLPRHARNWGVNLLVWICTAGGEMCSVRWTADAVCLVQKTDCSAVRILIPASAPVTAVNG